MAVQYNRLWKLLIDKKMKKSALTELADVSSSTIAKLNRDEYVSLEVLERICRLWLRTRGWDSRFEVVWDDINLQDEVEEARAELYREQARKLRIENDRKEKGE